MIKNIFILMSVLLLNVSASVQAQEEVLYVSEPINSGCLSRSTRSYEEEVVSRPTIVLEKEGNVLFVQLLNYNSNCGTKDFELENKVSGGIEEVPCSLTVNVTPVVPAEMDCYCPFNISFTMHDLNPNSFYLRCWWYEGQVELTEGEPLKLEYVSEDVVIDGMKYCVLNTTHQAKLLYQSDWNSESHVLKIPSEVEHNGQTYTVTSINESVFPKNKTLTKVIIPRTIKNMDFGSNEGIYVNPFSGCLSIESIEVEEGNPEICSVDGVLFSKNKTTLVGYPKASPRKTYSVPDGVTAVSDGAFYASQNLQKIVLPEGLNKIGYRAFAESECLEEVNIPSGIKELRIGTFQDCKKLTSVEIPDGVTHIYDFAFSGCSSLTAVSMPESVVTVDFGAFGDCQSLTKVILSPNLQLIPNGMFSGCARLTDLVIPSSVTSIGAQAFFNCAALESLDLPESVITMDFAPFANCNLKTLFIRGKILDRYLESGIFRNMGTKTVVYVPDSEVEKYKKIYDGPVYPLSSSMTGIYIVTSSSETQPTLHDLQGRRLSQKPAKGVYIQDGKKVVVK